MSKALRLEKIAREIPLLNLAQNRALVSARLGNLYGRTDEKRARELYNQAGAELIAAQKTIEVSSGVLSTHILGFVRRQVLQLIVKNDAELGFELFVKSRPQLISDALANKSLPDFGSIILSDDEPSPAQNFIRQENELEQALALAVVSTNEQKAIEILRRDEPETIVQNTYHLLKELWRNNPLVADEIARRIVQCLLTVDLARSVGAIRFINQLLTESLIEDNSSDHFQIEPQDIRRLAEKEADFLIKSGRNSPGNNYEYVLSIRPTLIQLVPERAAELNEITIAQKSSVSFGLTIGKNHQNLIEKSTDQQIAAEAKKMPLPLREMFYSSIANGIAATGDLKRAKDLLAKNFSGQRLIDLHNSLYQAYARLAIQKGDDEKAAAIINQIAPELRYHALADLAIAVYAKTPTEKSEKARVYLKRAEESLSPTPTTRDDFVKLDKIASAAALIEPDAGFRMLETLIEKYIEVGTANALVESYQGRTGIKASNNELLLSNHARLVPINFSLKNFMAADSERAMQLIDRIECADLRINLELLALEKAQNINFIF